MVLKFPWTYTRTATRLHRTCHAPTLSFHGSTLFFHGPTPSCSSRSQVDTFGMNFHGPTPKRDRGCSFVEIRAAVIGLAAIAVLPGGTGWPRLLLRPPSGQRTCAPAKLDVFQGTVRGASDRGEPRHRRSLARPAPELPGGGEARNWRRIPPARRTAAAGGRVCGTQSETRARGLAR